MLLVFPRRIEISGEKGTIGIEDNRIVRWSFTEEWPEDQEILRQFSGGATTAGGAADPTAVHDKGHRLIVEDFVKSVREKRKPFVDGEDGKASVGFVCAVYEAIRTGGSVKLA